MSAIRLPSEEKINPAYDMGKSAAIVPLQTTFQALAERIQKMEDRLAKNSRNSGKPPSRDGYGQPASKSLRRRSRRRSSGQVGHKGETLKMVEKPDHLRSMKRQKAIREEKCQMFDVPQIRFETREHRAEIKTKSVTLSSYKQRLFLTIKLSTPTMLVAF